ncbi:hypothetical protein FJY93_04695 [Candidatus Kaiserbacteria bacterium]|nr:hypothetical protein [Candidatus Kaiserbacteria bacterium]
MTPSFVTSFNLDLLIVGISSAAIGLIGFLIFINNTRSKTAHSFLFFAILTIAWNISNFVQYKFTTVDATLIALRLNLFVATWHAFSFFRFSYVFPQIEDTGMPRWYTLGVLPVTVATSILVLTPLVFSHIDSLAPVGMVTNPVRGPGIALFALVAFGLLFLGLTMLYRKWRTTTGAQERTQTGIVLFGMSVTALLIISFNVVLPIAFNTLSFLPFSGLFIFPFIALISYAIYRYHLFDIKVFATGWLGFLVTVFSFVNVIHSQTTGAIVINVVAFCIILFGSIQIIRAMLELENINARQESLLYFVSHEVKVYLTKGSYAFASIADGDFGSISDQLKTMSIDALGDMREGLTTVMNILGAANLKKGVVKYNKNPFDLKATIESVIRQQKPMADKKHLTIDMMMGQDSYTIVGDDEKIAQHVIRNLIDNAIKYTPSGEIHADLTRTEDAIRFSVRDTGVGITPDDIAHLFTEGGKGKESTKVNVHSTGYGLFVAKTVCDAHGAKIWAESRGADKGARFVVEFPIAS